MLGRPKINAAAPTIRSSFADAAFAVEERVVWGGIDLLRSLLEAVKWPFERVAWTIERGLVWPLEERTDSWSGSARAAGVALLVLLAAGAGVLAFAWISSSGSGSTAPVPEVAAPAVKPEPLAAQTPQAPILHGAVPDFAPEAGDAAAKPSAGESVTTARADSTASTTTSPTTADEKVADPGPAAIDVARRFSSAFVLYEVGRIDAKVRAALRATASPQLLRDLLRRPPRLPANVEVPKAKVLNVVPGPRHGDTFTLSASLLRVGVTSELRLNVQRDETSGQWQVMEALG